MYTYSRQELIDELQRLADDLGKVPTALEMEESGQIGHKTFERRFGSWNEALEAAGFPLNNEWDISERRLLEAFRCLANGNLAPQKQQIVEGEFSVSLYQKKGGIWQAAVRAGLAPYNRRPLTDQQFNDFFDAAVDGSNPTRQLVVQLFQFTGLTPEVITNFTDDWITKQPTGTVVTVPDEFTTSESEWVFKLPQTFDDGRKTNLSEFIQWYFDQYNSIQINAETACRDAVHHTAKDASLNRRIVETPIGPAPEVRPTDLRTTGGVRLARNNAPAKRIRRHLGLEHTNWKADVEDFFLYAYVHYDHEHPNYDPPDVVLEPVNPDSSPE